MDSPPPQFTLLDSLLLDDGELTLLPVGSGNTFGQATGIALDILGNPYISGWIGTSSSSCSGSPG
jgi:hypothetical protein